MHRVFATILGMTVVDAYNAYRYELIENQAFDKTVLNFNDFVSQFSYQLVFNEHTMTRALRSDARAGRVEEVASILSPFLSIVLTLVFFQTAHTLKAFCDLSQYAEARASGKRVQRQCNIC
ncbi:hypothetical protein F444_17489, partial [Phytophthora nicotianae P1976]